MLMSTQELKPRWPIWVETNENCEPINVINYPTYKSFSKNFRLTVFHLKVFYLQHIYNYIITMSTTVFSNENDHFLKVCLFTQLVIRDIVQGGQGTLFACNQFQFGFISSNARLHKHH